MNKVIRSLMIFFLALYVSAGAAANPFIDLPKGHWAYSAIETLSSQGIISGYENGTLRGPKTLTRYEAASLLARALVYINDNYATEEQMKIVKNMCTEFREELKTLDLRVESDLKEIDILKSRLSGWRIGGSLHLDAQLLPQSENSDENRFSLARSRINISRYFGENDSMYFHAQIDGFGAGTEDLSLEFSKFYVGISLSPTWRLTAGRFSMDFEGNGMNYYTGRFGDYSQGAWFTDVDRSSIAVTKDFSLGSFSAYFAGRDTYDKLDKSFNFAAYLSLKPSENFETHIGFDFKDIKNENSSLNSMSTLWIMPQYHITSDVSIKGAFYAQFNNYKSQTDVKTDSPKAWRAILDIKQSLLKYTSLWLEYDKLDQNFILTRGTTALMLSDRDYRNFFQTSNLGADLSIWRVGMNQIWNSKWSTWLYFARCEFGNYETNNGNFIKPAMDEISAGVEYQLNSSVYFSLGYFYYKYNEDALLEKDRRLIFRTSITF